MSVERDKKDVLRKTLDEDEVSHHEKLAEDWWDEDGPMKALHSMNSIRIQFIRSGLLNTGRLKEEDVESRQDYLTGVRILDVGCGGGILSIPLARLGADVTGIEPSSVLAEVARREALSRLPSGRKVQFLSTTVEGHETGNEEAYDAVVLSEVIEHITLKEDFIGTCVNTLKPGGSIFITTVNRTVASWLGAIVVAEHIFNFLPKGTHEWDKFVTPDELKVYLRTVGCRTMQICGTVYIPFLNEWYWVPNASVLYALHAVKLNKRAQGA